MASDATGVTGRARSAGSPTAGESSSWTCRGGAGKTRWARPGWSTAEMAAGIHAITVHLGLRRPAIAGISMGGTIALQYALDHPGDVCRLVLVDSFPGIPAEFTAERDRQLAFIETHGLREIAEERMALAFTANADPGTKAWVTEMIASGDLRDTGTRPGPRSASTPRTGSENSSSRSPSSTGS